MGAEAPMYFNSVFWFVVYQIELGMFLALAITAHCKRELMPKLLPS